MKRALVAVVLMTVAAPVWAQKVGTPPEPKATGTVQLPTDTPTSTPTADPRVPTPTATATLDPLATPTPKPRPTAVKGAVDQRAAVVKVDVTAKQDQYFAAHGRYFQGIQTSAAPADGATITPNLGVKPSDQAETWADLFPSTFNASEPTQYEIHTYSGPSGSGWVLYTRVILDGVEHLKAENHGAESFRTYDWAELTPTPTPTPTPTATTALPRPTPGGP